MSLLPASWTVTRLGTVTNFNYGKALPSHSRTGVGFPVFGSNGVVGNHAPPLTNGPTIVIGRKGSVGAVQFSSEPCSPIDTTYYVTEVPGGQLRYWYYLLWSLDLASLNKSTAIPGLSREDAYRLEVPIAPLAEQKRIADKLDTVLSRVDAVNARLARVAPILKRFRQSVLAAAISGRLTEDWRRDSDSKWSMLRADIACSKVQSGGTPKGGFSDKGVPFLKVYNIVDQKIAFDYKPQYVSNETNATELRKSQVQPGDVLMNIVGPPLGKVAIVPRDHAAWNINQAITLFRPSDQISSDWIYIVLCEGAPIRDVLTQTKGSVGQVNISLSQCRAFELPVPPPNEQVEIVRRVEILFAFADRLDARLSAAQKATARLTPSLLAKAFRGELVPQDPNDEPASELLRRLAQTSPAGTSRGRRKAVATA